MSAADRIDLAYERIEQADRPEVWITLRLREEALAEAAGASGPLAGAALAVKDNIDVAGMQTTAGCPAYAYEPNADAPVVARLRAAGAIVVGKTNLDQFATGLVGTRSPYGAVRDARRPSYVSGGSSSGSGVAVALGLADLALGTDTAGSGRVPAAFQGICGVKPTRGLVPATGVVPACRTLDCVTVMTRELGEAEAAMAVMAGTGGGDPLEREWPTTAPLGAPPASRVAVPQITALPDLVPSAITAFESAAARLAQAGAELVEVDIDPLLAAARLLYEGAFVAERHAAVGEFVEAHPDAVNPTVGAIIVAAGRFAARDLATDAERLAILRRAAEAELAGTDALLMPTAPRQPTIAEVASDPVGVNSLLGTYTNFCNLLDFAAVAVPGGDADGGSFGVTVMAPAFHDRVAADIARLLTGGTAGTVFGPPSERLLVVGAHRAGQPLNGQLTSLGARLAATLRTAPEYRLYRLATDPPKPGLVRVTDGGESIEGELWELPVAGLGAFLAALPTPMALGRVRLEDGSEATGFLCETLAIEDAEDISVHGSWLEYLAACCGDRAAAGGRRSDATLGGAASVKAARPPATRPNS